MAPSRRRRSAHDPGRVLRDLIVNIVDAGDRLADLGVLREQPDLFGEVASSATAGRAARSGRRVFLRLQRSWRRTPLLGVAFRRLRVLLAAT